MKIKKKHKENHVSNAQRRNINIKSDISSDESQQFKTMDPNPVENGLRTSPAKNAIQHLG